MRHRPLDPQALADGLAAPWRRIDVVTETGSTNADLLTRATAGEDVDGIVLIAEHQTAGRGRGGRAWVGVPRAQIAFSVGIDTADVPAAGWGWLPLTTGVAVLDAVAAVTGVEAGLKWPNDVLVGDRKLAGILAEASALRASGSSGLSALRASGSSVIVVGIGLNVTLRSDDIAQPGATSLLELGVNDLDRNSLVLRLLGELGTRVGAWRAAGGADAQLLADYRRASVTISAPVRATLPGDREIIGVAQSIDEQGRLCIDAGGQVFAVSAADVVHLRPGR